MRRFRCHKEVNAGKIIRIDQGKRAVDGGTWILCLDDGTDTHTGTNVEVSHAWYLKHSPLVGGYLVEYADGYQSFSPAKAFEEGYTAI